MTGTITITLKSDLCAGSGESTGVTVDSDLCIGSSGLPYIPARRLKGCLRQSAEWLQTHGCSEAKQANITALFGTNDGVTGCIRIGDARLPGANAMEAWLASDAVPAPLEWAAKPLNVGKLFTYVRGQTRLENGLAVDGSLRYTRVMERYNALDRTHETVLEASVTVSESAGIPAETLNELLTKCCQATRHIGTMRNRGLGNVRMDWREETTKDASGHSSDKKPAFPLNGTAEISYTVSLDAPVTLPGCGEQSLEIPARSVIGCVADAYLREGDAQSPDFQKLFLDGTVRWSALTPMIAGKHSVPAPLCLVFLKNAEVYQNLLAVPAQTEQKQGTVRPKQKTVSGRYAVPQKEGFALANVRSHTVYHHSHRQPGARGEEGTLYMQDSLDAGMLYGGTVTVPAELAERVSELLQKTEFAFGRSRSAQYASCTLVGQPRTVSVLSGERVADPEAIRIGSKDAAGQEVYAILESDLILVRNGVYQTDDSSVREALAKILDVENVVPDGSKDICQYHVISGYQRQWQMQKPQIPAVRGGSVYCFQAKKGTSIPERVVLGEFRQEGFGVFRIYTKKEMSQLTRIEKAEVERKNADRTEKAWLQKLQTALTVSAGTDALYQSVWAYYRKTRATYRENQRRGNAARWRWFRPGTVGRLRLMLAQADDYPDFLARIQAIRQSDTHAQNTESDGKKALELVRGFCGQDSLSVKTMLSREAPELLERVCSDSEAEKQLAEKWREALRLLLHIANYDKDKR